MRMARRIQLHTKNRKRFGVAIAISAFLPFAAAINSFAKTGGRQGEVERRSLTPLQLEIQKQQQRLTSSEVEERRDALMRLGALRHPDASRVAASALSDALPIVRATAVHAVLCLPMEESAAALITLLSDKDEFVRQETAYALGKTRSKSAVPALVERLFNDRKNGVRGSAAVALGQIADDAAVVPLAHVLQPQAAMPGSKKARQSKSKENAFVLRAAARSLGQIGSRAGVPALIATLEDEEVSDDVRREAAIALGWIGDPMAVSALRSALMARDSYLSLAAAEAMRKIAP
jgi:HEAT repeat protein